MTHTSQDIESADFVLAGPDLSTNSGLPPLFIGLHVICKFCISQATPVSSCNSWTRTHQNSQARGETNAWLDFPLSETCGATLNSHRMGWGRGGSQFTCMFLFISWVQIRKVPGFPDKVQMLPTSYKNSLPHKDCTFQDGRNLTRSTVGQNLKGTAQGNSGLPGIWAAFKGAVVNTAVKLSFPT